MAHYDHLREIAVLPCLPAGLSVEDRYLQRSAPSFGPLYAMPDDAFAVERVNPCPAVARRDEWLDLWTFELLARDQRLGQQRTVIGAGQQAAQMVAMLMGNDDDRCGAHRFDEELAPNARHRLHDQHLPERPRAKRRSVNRIS